MLRLEHKGKPSPLMSLSKRQVLFPCILTAPPPREPRRRRAGIRFWTWIEQLCCLQLPFIRRRPQQNTVRAALHNLSSLSLGCSTECFYSVKVTLQSDFFVYSLLEWLSENHPGQYYHTLAWQGLSLKIVKLAIMRGYLAYSYCINDVLYQRRSLGVTYC